MCSSAVGVAFAARSIRSFDARAAGRVRRAANALAVVLERSGVKQLQARRVSAKTASGPTGEDRNGAAQAA